MRGLPLKCTTGLAQQVWINFFTCSYALKNYKSYRIILKSYLSSAKDCMLKTWIMFLWTFFHLSLYEETNPFSSSNALGKLQSTYNMFITVCILDHFKIQNFITLYFKIFWFLFYKNVTLASWQKSNRFWITNEAHDI